MLIYEINPVCIALQETMMGNTNVPCPKEYVIYRSPYNPNRGSHGGVLVYVRHDIPHKPCKTLHHFDSSLWAWKLAAGV